MIQGTLENFIKIFKDHAEAETDLQYFAYGEVFLVEERMQSDPDFAVPLLWLDEPEISPDRNRTNLYINKFNTAVWLIVQLEATADYVAIEETYAAAHAKLDKVVAMLYKLERERAIVEFKIGKEEAISRAFVRTGTLIGWRAELSLSLQTTTIHHVS
jgi:hypothetical protein